mmetsp:Transcript_118999/g.381297  ORF Transcript_118999/g.381297 Transcript_118999/m.381297 type:complete len:468 (+) Transcript_118999:287-1690(+)
MPLPLRQSETGRAVPPAGARSGNIDGDGSGHGDGWSSPRWIRVPVHAVHSRPRRLVEHEFFDYTVAVAILLNSILMGVQAQFAAVAARDPDDDGEPPWLRLISTAFCSAFTAELLLRIILYRCAFFTMDGWRWNVFDVVVVGLQLIEEIIAFEAAQTWNGLQSQRRERTTSLSFMRILRMLRLVRIIRVVRVLRLVRELRTMVHSIGSTLVSLFWIVLLLLLLIYVTGICFTQMVADSGMDDPEGVEEGTKAHMFFGSLDRSILSLYQAMTGGVNWKDVMDALVGRTSPVMAFVFCIYIAFAVLAMLNVITGVFVGSALAKATEEDCIDLLHGLREAVETMKIPGTNRLQWDSFESQLKSATMQHYFQSIDLDPSEASGLFRLLDQDGSGTIEAEDFVMGCLRLHGAATAIDLTTLMCEVRWMRRRWLEHAMKLEDRDALTPRLASDALHTRAGQVSDRIPKRRSGG